MTFVVDDILARLDRARRSGSGWVARCPAHDDTTPSLAIDLGDDGRVLVFCHAGCTYQAVVAALGLEASALAAHDNTARRPRARKRLDDGTPRFTPADARRCWDLALKRARDDEHVDDDRDVYRYLEGRGLLASWEERAFGVLAEAMPLPKAIALWPARGYAIVCPLFDSRGDIAGIQDRRRNERKPKTLFPAGQTSSRLLFANGPGRAVLKATSTATRVVYGEGLTDTLALTIASSMPVLCAPGTAFVAGAIGAWARGRDVLLAIDNDKAGERTIDEVARRALAQGATTVRRVAWPNGSKDACDVLRSGGVEALAAIIEGTQ